MPSSDASQHIRDHRLRRQKSDTTAGRSEVKKLNKLFAIKLIVIGVLINFDKFVRIFLLLLCLYLLLFDTLARMVRPEWVSFGLKTIRPAANWRLRNEQLISFYFRFSLIV